MNKFKEERHQVEELEAIDASRVAGGIAPLLGLAAAGIGHFTARSLVTGLAARYGLAYAVFDVAKSYGGGKRYSGNDDHR
ncbi:MAG: hypothetical protein V2I66_10765 [Halieaceae bacterium]|nr:hypothetical protein [Halieaceae bacterium]